MANQRLTRSSRTSSSMSSTTHESVEEALTSTNTPRSTPTKSRPGRLPSKPATGVRTRSAARTGSTSADEEGSDASAEVEGDDTGGAEEMPAVFTPSNVTLENLPASNAAFGPVPLDCSWAGLSNDNAVNEGVQTPHTSKTVNEVDMDSVDIPISHKNTRVVKYLSRPDEEDGSDAEDADQRTQRGTSACNNVIMSNIDELDNDEGYDELERFSEASESSAQFEAEVEKDILEAGEGGIDWDHPDIYKFDADLAGSSYASNMQLEELGPMYTQEVQEQFPELGGDNIVDRHFGTDWTISSLSSGSSTGGDSSDGSQPDSSSGSRDQTDGLDLESLNNGDDDGDTTDEEIPVSKALSSPLRALTRRISGERDQLLKRITISTPPRIKGYQRPVMKSLSVGPKKAICYSMKGPFGSRHFRFIPSRIRNLTWVDIRSSRSNSTTPSSVPSSPTMIDLNVALSEGNTGSGAHITDAIHGRLFQQFHCSNTRRRTLESSVATEFERNAYLLNDRRALRPNPLRLNSFLDQFGGDGNESLLSDDDMDLIDFDGGIEDDNNDDDDIFSSAPIQSTPLPGLRAADPFVPSILSSSPIFNKNRSNDDQTPDDLTLNSAHPTLAEKDPSTHSKKESISSNIRGLQLADEDLPSHNHHNSIEHDSTIFKTPKLNQNSSGYHIKPPPVTPLKRRVSDVQMDDKLLSSCSPSTRRKLH